MLTREPPLSRPLTATPSSLFAVTWERAPVPEGMEDEDRTGTPRSYMSLYRKRAAPCLWQICGQSVPGHSHPNCTEIAVQTALEHLYSHGPQQTGPRQKERAHSEMIRGWKDALRATRATARPPVQPEGEPPHLPTAPTVASLAPPSESVPQGSVPWSTELEEKEENMLGVSNNPLPSPAQLPLWPLPSTRTGIVQMSPAARA